MARERPVGRLALFIPIKSALESGVSAKDDGILRKVEVVHFLI